jgi:hypothetical protein
MTSMTTDRAIRRTTATGGNPRTRHTRATMSVNRKTIPACFTLARNSMNGIAPTTTLRPRVAIIMTGLRNPNMVMP